jgi:hypothetical protein
LHTPRDLGTGAAKADGNTHMKTFLKILALAIAAGFPCVAFAQFAGAPVPAAFNAESATLVFALIVGALLMLGDYGRARPSLVAASSNPIGYRMLEATTASAHVQRSHAYGIQARRNAEASKLAA